jgi:plasmid stability protein
MLTWRGSRRIGGPRDWNVPDGVPDGMHPALCVLAAQHGRSAEAEIRDILERAMKPATRVRLGDALAALGRKVGLTDEDVAIIDQTRDRSPAEPTILSDCPSQGTGTPMDLSRACARPARAFKPSR